MKIKFVLFERTLEMIKAKGVIRNVPYFSNMFFYLFIVNCYFIYIYFDDIACRKHLILESILRFEIHICNI